MVASADRRPPASTDVVIPSYLPLVLVNLATLFSAIGNGIAIVVLPGWFSNEPVRLPTRR